MVMFAGLGRIIVLAVMVGRTSGRSDPQLRALDALKPSLSYDGWQKDVLEAERYLLIYPEFFDGHLASMRKKQSLHGDRSYPSLFDGLYDGLFDFSSAAERAAAERASQLRALVALKPSLSYDGWQKDLREADMYRFSYPRRFDGHLASMRKKQSLHDDFKALMVVVVVVMVVMVMVFGRRAFDGWWWWLGSVVLWWVSVRWELVKVVVVEMWNVVFVMMGVVVVVVKMWELVKVVVVVVVVVVEMVAKKAAAFFRGWWWWGKWWGGGGGGGGRQEGSRREGHSGEGAAHLEEKVRRAMSADGFALRPLVLESDAQVRDSLEALLQTQHPDWLGKGKDVSKKNGPYDSLKLACAWEVNQPGNLDKYTAGVKRVQMDMDRLKKKGKDVKNLPGMPVRTLGAAKGFTMNAGANEAILLHGTIPERLLELLSTGLNERYSGTSAGTAFGDGVYCAEDIGKTDQYLDADSTYDPSSELHKRLYSKTVRHPGDVFYVLVVRAALGYPVRTQQMGQKATSMDGSFLDKLMGDLTPIFPKSFRELSAVPGVAPPIVHHSLIAEPGLFSSIARYREFVLFHSEYLHIDYVIAYHRCNGGQKLRTK